MDISAFLPDDDEPVTEVEHIVSLPKTAETAVFNRRQGFRPPRSVEVRLRSDEGHDLSITGYVDSIGRVYLDLQYGEQRLRSLHNHPGHRNPDRSLVDSPHMHFPSKKYRLSRGGSSYAYCLTDCDDDYDDVIEGVDIFCTEINAALNVWQPPL